MSSQPKLPMINRWVDRIPYLLLCTGLCIFGLILVSPLLLTKKFDQTFTLSAEGTKSLGPVEVKPQAFGTVRIEVDAQLQNQRWATYEVQLLDRGDKLLVAGVKNAWRQSGTWSEGGESGTWSEEDEGSGFDLQLRRVEPVKIVVSLVEVSDTRGQVVQEPVSFRVTAHQGAIETWPLWFGSVSLVVMAGLGWRRQ